MITIEEARLALGARVTYQSHPSAPVEEGELVSVSRDIAFVRYGGQHTAKATRPDDLSWANPVDAQRRMAAARADTGGA